jgi:hypothetical protein
VTSSSRYLRGDAHTQNITALAAVAHSSSFSSLSRGAALGDPRLSSRPLTATKLHLWPRVQSAQNSIVTITTATIITEVIDAGGRGSHGAAAAAAACRKYW